MPRHRGLVCVFARAEMLIGFVVALSLFAGTALADEKEPFAVVELGAAGEWALPSGGSGFGPTAAVEFTPIKNWLEIEAGVATLFSQGQTEWDTDFLFKKPFDLSPTVEFEPGYRTGVDPFERRWQNDRYLHVLADAGPNVWMVFRARLRLRFRQRPALAWGERWPAHWHSLVVQQRSRPRNIGVVPRWFLEQSDRKAAEPALKECYEFSVIYLVQLGGLEPPTS
jgi:hypothetical protein